MSNAYRDQNNVTTLIAASNVDGQTPIRLYADPVTHRLLVDSTGSGGGGTWYQDEIVATGMTGTSFSLLHVPQTIVFLFKNGQYLVSGVGQDYTRSGTALTLAVSLLSSDLLTANYS